MYFRAIKPEYVPGVNGLDPNGVYVTDAYGRLRKVGFRQRVGRPVGSSKKISEPINV